MSAEAWALVAMLATLVSAKKTHSLASAAARKLLSLAVFCPFSLFSSFPFFLSLSLASSARWPLFSLSLSLAQDGHSTIGSLANGAAAAEVVGCKSRELDSLAVCLVVFLQALCVCESQQGKKSTRLTVKSALKFARSTPIE